MTAYMLKCCKALWGQCQAAGVCICAGEATGFKQALKRRVLTGNHSLPFCEDQCDLFTEIINIIHLWTLFLKLDSSDHLMYFMIKLKLETKNIFLINLREV